MMKALKDHTIHILVLDQMKLPFDNLWNEGLCLLCRNANNYDSAFHCCSTGVIVMVIQVESGLPSDFRKWNFEAYGA